MGLHAELLGLIAKFDSLIQKMKDLRMLLCLNIVLLQLMHFVEILQFKKNKLNFCFITSDLEKIASFVVLLRGEGH